MNIMIKTLGEHICDDVIKHVILEYLPSFYIEAVLECKKEKYTVLDNKNEVFENMTLNGCNLYELQFTKCTFKNCVFSCVSFLKCTFIDCSFKNCKWFGSDLTTTMFKNTKFKKVRFESTYFTFSNFDDCKAREQIYSGCTFKNTYFKGDYTMNSFEMSKFLTCYFEFCNLSASSFKESEIVQCIFYKCESKTFILETIIYESNINFSNSYLYNNQFIEFYMDDEPIFNETKFSKTNNFMTTSTKHWRASSSTLEAIHCYDKEERKGN